MTKKTLQDFVFSLGLGSVRTLKRYTQGQHNDSYYVATSLGKYTLRVYKYKKKAEILFELGFMKAAKGPFVPHVLSFGGERVLEWEGKCAVFYRYLPGKHLKRFTKKQLYSVGKFIGDMQNKVEGFAWQGKRYAFYHLPDSKIKKFVSAINDSSVPYKKYLPEIVAALKKCRLPKSLPQGPIHVDVKPENVLFFERKLSGVLDFDNSFVGPLLLDLTKAIVWFGTKGGVFDVRVALELFKGYTSVRKLSALEYASLYKGIKFAFLSHVFVDYQMRATGKTNATYFRFIVKELYGAYLGFKMGEEEFYALFDGIGVGVKRKT